MRKHLIHILSLSLLLGACDKDYWPHSIETSITKVTTAAPANNLSLALDPLSNAVVRFEWSAAKTGNHTPVYYKILFDKEGGNFSQPIYSFTSASQGTKTNLTITHRDLNKVASKAGIKALEKGKVIWTVVASNGVNSDTSADKKVMELERPIGFAENPVEVYLTGSATETGTEAGKALRLKKLSDGVFEIYTALDVGTYHFIDGKTGTPISFAIEGTLIKLGTEGASPATTRTPYRINLDFNTATARLTEIVEVGLWFAAYNQVTNVLAYDGGGIWKAGDIPIVFKQESWGKDDRYKFRVVEKDANGDTKNVFQASVKKDNNKPTGSTAADYWYFKSNDPSQWDYTYKFEKESPKADILVKFVGDNYTHQIIYK